MPPLTTIKELDDLAFPAWDLFPLNNYWNLAHGPQGRDRYLPFTKEIWTALEERVGSYKIVD